MLAQQSSTSQIKIQDVNLTHFLTNSAVKSAIETSDGGSSIKLAEQLHSDLVPAKYEGTFYLVNFCMDQNLSWTKRLFFHQFI